MNKRCIMTVAIGDYYKKIAELTHPFMKAYAEKIDADFVVIDEVNPKFSTQKWQKFQIHELLNRYQRLIFFDTDILVRDDTPDLFDIVPENKFAAFDEGRYESRLEFIRDASKAYGEDVFNWNGKFYNSGVMVMSRIHKHIFKLPIKCETIETDQPYINLRLAKDKYEVQDLHWDFNRMSMMDKIIGISRYNSYILHYAGAPEDQLFPILLKDIEYFKEHTPNYPVHKRNVVISVSAGMGDQLCTEPVIRYTKKHIFPDSDMKVVTHHPRLFQHIKEVEVLDYNTYKGNDDATLVLHSCPDDKDSEHHLSHVMFHPTDFSSISMIKQTIPPDEKDIKLEVDPEDFSEIIEIAGITDLREFVLVHPGKWWPSKTFPVEWWQKIIDDLVEEGYKVGIIGKRMDDKQGYVDVTCPSGAVDFRDLTTLGGLIAIISQAKITITNDSCPVHISGAFDNWLVVIPSAKWPWHIIPYRHGRQDYKVKALYKKLTIDDLDINFTSFSPDTIDIVRGDMLDYIPDPEEVIKNVNEINITIEKNKPVKKIEEKVEEVTVENDIIEDESNPKTEENTKKSTKRKYNKMK
jgi:hypothetical protein